MVRDMDIIRDLLLRIEAQTAHEAQGVFRPSNVEREVLDGHMMIMLDRGLIEAKDWQDMQGHNWAMARLAWEGHDFLDSIRDDEIWRKTKEGVAKAGGFSLDLIKALAKGLIKKKIEHHTGVELDL